MITGVVNKIQLRMRTTALHAIMGMVRVPDSQSHEVLTKHSTALRREERPEF